jgi:release factor glutamine methyltransferase
MQMAPEVGEREHEERTAYVGRMEIRWDARILEPRPWTADQSRWAARLLTELPPGPVLELCSGAGHIGLLAVCGTRRELVCVDIDPVATAYAEENAARNGVSGVEVRTQGVEEAAGDTRRYVLVIADPPWVPSAETGRFPEDPLRAIDGGADGTDLALACARTAAAVLDPGGLLLLQLGTSAQVDAVVTAVAPTLLEVERRTCEGGVLVLLSRRG